MGDCAVCLEALGGAVAAYACDCAAVYHQRCVETWPGGCPACRGGGGGGDSGVGDGPQLFTCRKLTSLVEALSAKRRQVQELEALNSRRVAEANSLRSELLRLRNRAVLGSRCGRRRLSLSRSRSRSPTWARTSPIVRRCLFGREVSPFTPPRRRIIEAAPISPAAVVAPSTPPIRGWMPPGICDAPRIRR
eukprot:TRINITY_DN11324_c0_g1_i1.p1 TRINITY_DN11324_c0_g1~~TRINITY_DN11324_c0_g1_i1.p1  ORF type:complete len:203 (-),score=28.90 TRINITY_DN11324_c0_g1_i1:427-999(-)